MKKIIVLLFAGIVATCVYLYYKPRASLSNTTADVNIGAVALYDAYQKEEAASDQQFLNKVIIVTGTVAGVQQTDSSLSVSLKGGATGGIICRMAADKQEGTTVPVTGSVVSIKGRCTGFLMDVLLADCLIEKK